MDSCPHQMTNCPENTASWSSRVFFSWPYRLLQTGHERVLTSDDIPALCPSCSSAHMYSKFDKIWNDEQAMGDHENDIICNGTPENKETTSNTTKKSDQLLAWTIMRSLKWRFLGIQALHLLCSVLLWIAPAHLRTLIAYVENPWGGMSQGVLLVASLFVTQSVDSILYQQFIYQRNKLEIATHNLLMTAMYRKSLRLSSTGRKNNPVGKMLTMMSTDANEAGLAINSVAFGLLTPLNIVVASIQLILLLGPASALSLAGSVLIVVFNIHIASRMQRLLKRRMEKQDSRMKLLTEVLSGIKTIKLHAWESCFRDRVTRRREQEVEVLSDIFLLKIPLLLSTTVAPFLVSALTLAMYIYWYDTAKLNAAIIFSTVSLLKILRRGLNNTPGLFHDVARFHTHMARIQNFLEEDEVYVERNADFRDHVVQIHNGSFTWDKSSSPVLKDISVSINRGALIGVVGQVGSGKTALIHAMLGEMVTVKGSSSLQGTVGYVPQQAWLQNSTLEQNITFGREMKENLYENVLNACALTQDLHSLPGGDQTEIGEKGANLSGGQKQRVSLARAVYNDADIYLLDDPLSAVDSNVCSHIFDNLISNRGLLREKTRILVTNNTAILPRVDNILVIHNQAIEERGTYSELMSKGGLFRHIVASSPSSEMGDIPHCDKAAREDDNHEGRRAGDKQLGKLVEEETVEHGGIKMNVIHKFLNAFGVRHWMVIVGLYFLYYAMVSIANIWLSVWAEHGKDDVNYSHKERSNYWYIAVYFTLGLLQAAVILGYSIGLKHYTVVASKNLHSGMLSKVLQSPMNFFETTPIGRMTNRFSQDMNTIDKDLPFIFELWMDSFFQTICSLGIVLYSAPTVAALLIPLFYLCMIVQRYYISTSRQLRRSYAQALSNVLSFYSESCQGVEVIRAFKEENRFIQRFIDLNDGYHRFNYYNFVANRWLSIRLSFVCHVVLACTALLIFTQGDRISSGVLGLALSFAYETSNDLRMFIIRNTRLDLMSVAVDKITQYVSLEAEKNYNHGSQTVPTTWPRHGDVRFQNLSLRYRPGLPLALNGVNVTVRPGEKIGIVGRTGAGKSSLMLSMFRLVDPVQGAVIIDDVNIADVGLVEIRSRLTVIPQDPILFSETLRTNLDPNDAYNDEEIWTALKHVNLDIMINMLPQKLLYKCQEGGKNFSIGQRQLLCLARTLLRKSRILVLDEATAAVDMETDELIQQTIRSEFKDCTVLTIAHRLHTVMDYDRILVLNRGRVEACDTPQNLLKDTEGLFYRLALHAGIV